MKKICFFWGRRFVYVGHEMAKILQEEYNCKNFCAIITQRAGLNFLKNQTDVKYSNILLEEDVYKMYKDEQLDYIYLADLEKEYGIPCLWTYIMSDRILMYGLLLRAYPSDTPIFNHEDMLRILQVTSKQIKKFLNEEKPDVIFFSTITNLTNYLLYEIARKNGIKTIMMYDTRIGGFGLTEEYDNHSFLEQALVNIKENPNDPQVFGLKKQAEKYLLEFQRKPSYYMKNSEANNVHVANRAKKSYHFKFLQPRKLGTSIGWFIKSHYEYFINKNNDKEDYNTVKPWLEVWDKGVRKLRVLRGYNDLYDTMKKDEDFIYFALHSEPEALPYLLAPYFKDQVWLIKQVARSLPVSYKLYVKDHPMMVGLRTRNFYKEIKKMPNVKLINPAITSFDIIPHTKLAITITGTSAWESILLKKPVILFGKAFYHKISSVKVCEKISDLPYIIHEQLKLKSNNQEEIINFIAALYKEKAMVDLAQIWEIEGGANPEKKKLALAPLVKLFCDKVKLV